MGPPVDGGRKSGSEAEAIVWVGVVKAKSGEQVLFVLGHFRSRTKRFERKGLTCEKSCSW